MTPITSIATIDDLITSLLKVGYQKSTDYPTKYGTFFVNQCTGREHDSTFKIETLLDHEFLRTKSSIGLLLNHKLQRESDMK